MVMVRGARTHMPLTVSCMFTMCSPPWRAGIRRATASSAPRSSNRAWLSSGVVLAASAQSVTAFAAMAQQQRFAGIQCLPSQAPLAHVGERC